MEDLQIALNSARVEQRNQGLWIRSWHIGQTLQALVVDQSPSRGTLLRIDGHQLVVPADIPAQKGASLMMQVAHLHPAPVLKLIQVVNPAPPPVVHFAALSELTEKLAKQARTLISKQGKLDPAIAALLGLRAKDYPDIRVNLIDSLRRVIRKTEDLTGSKEIAESLREIGSFSTQGQSNITHLFIELEKDIKSSSLAPASALGEQIQAALAKIALNQLAGAQGEVVGKQEYYLDLPIWFNGELLTAELHISHKLDGCDEASDKSQRWQLLCRLDSQSVGKLVAKIYLDTASISLVIYAQSDEFLQEAEEQIGRLTSDMHDSGLQVSTVRCQRAEIFMPVAMDRFANSLDEQA